ncbi:MATE family efflux transporter [Qipengyuania flava]|uniref:MATE family efflux transporter n=1 Tax=Qipengyuania flava TaxID=192812 RepID=UPI001C635AF3|nr:MATE family efflux transporter [Qipengyuania flava]QYJ07081.1 MATE family efflux transporter [Qipengyuania flava]
MEPAPRFTKTGVDGWRTELGATLRLSWPLALANLLQMLIWAIDVFFVARLGEFELAASSLAVSLFSILVWGTITLVSMVAALISAELGRSRFAVAEVRRSVRMAVWLSVACGVIVMAILSQTEAILLATGQRPELAARAYDYMGLVLWSTVPLLVASVLRNFVSALGRPIFATAITALAIGVNALGNYALVFGNLGAPALGLEGSAIATIFTSVFVLLAYIVAIEWDRRLRRYVIWGRFWRPEWDRLKELFVLGMPVFFTTIAEAGLFGGAALLMGLIGESELAGHTIALQIAAFAFQVPFGVSQAATIRVGYHFGARNHEAIGRAGAVALLMAVLFMSFTAALMLLMPVAILSLYIDTSEPANAAMMGFALQYIVIAALFQLVDGLQVVAAGALRGLQDTRVPMWMAIFSYWVPGFGTSYYLGFHTELEGTGVWIGFAVGLTFATLLLTGRWLLRERLGLTIAPERPSQRRAPLA